MNPFKELSLAFAIVFITMLIMATKGFLLK